MFNFDLDYLLPIQVYSNDTIHYMHLLLYDHILISYCKLGHNGIKMTK